MNDQIPTTGAWLGRQQARWLLSILEKGSAGKQARDPELSAAVRLMYENMQSQSPVQMC